MIRVNLLRGASQAAGSGPSMGKAQTESSGVGTGDTNREFGTRLAILSFPILLAIAYGYFSDYQARNEFDAMKDENQQILQKLKGLDSAVKEVEKFQEEKKKLDSQLDVIKKLSRERLKNVKSLDNLQSLIPNRAWLSKLKITENKVELEGMATDDIVISDFMQALEASIYFKEVVLESSEESRRDVGVVKKFKVRCQLENL